MPRTESGQGTRISGKELFALSQPPTAERATAKIGRLRLGDCARKRLCRLLLPALLRAPRTPGLDNRSQKGGLS
jgi:hypothetical protein